MLVLSRSLGGALPRSAAPVALWAVAVGDQAVAASADQVLPPRLVERLANADIRIEAARQLRRPEDVKDLVAWVRSSSGGTTDPWVLREVAAFAGPGPLADLDFDFFGMIRMLSGD